MNDKKSLVTSVISESLDQATLNGRAIGYSPALIVSALGSTPSTLTAFTESSKEPKEMYPIA